MNQARETEAVFEHLVENFYRPLYRFALSLSGNENDAGDLVQQTFFLWATKGHQLRETSKAKNWLFTTLHREFLNRRRHVIRFPHQELDAVETELPPIESRGGSGVDADQMLAVLQELEEGFRGPIALFFLEDYSYQEIAAALELPLGTVKSRLSRGLRHLQERLRNPRFTTETRSPGPPP